VNAIVMPVAALALAWRRIQPTAVLIVSGGAIVVLSIAYGSSETWSSLFIALVAVYSGAAHSRSPAVVFAIAAAVSIAVTLEDPAIKTFGDAIWSSTLLGLTFLVGLTGRAIQGRSERLARRAESFDREQAERAAEAVAEERQHIARELHDIISHSLAVMMLQAGAAEQVLDKDPHRAREVLHSMRETGQEAIREMGTLLGLIRSGSETSLQPQPSLAELEVIISKMEQAGMHVGLTVEGVKRPLPAALELSAFRIVQEGLANSLKHAGTAEARVVLRYCDERFELEVEDDGRANGATSGGRRGLAGVRERVAVFGGHIDVGPRAEGGWRLRAAFPLSR
jgi:signal transduction histidine kinase